MKISAKKRLQFKNSFDGSIIFGTKKFNQVTGRNKLEDPVSERFTEFFINHDTGLLKSEMCEYRKCPVCDSNKNNLIFVKGGFRHVQCKCGFIYVNPTAKDKYREEFFRDIYHSWTDVLLTDEQKEIDKRKFEYGIAIIETYCENKGLLVDIGAGTGLFLEIAMSRRWKVVAVEFNKKAIEQIRSKGIRVVNKPLEQDIIKRCSADVVTLWEVLEHINDVNAFLTNVYKIMKTGALLYICVPNIDALVTRIMHEKSGTFAGYSHVNFFNTNTLGQLCKKHGFQILETDSFISEIGTIKNYLCYHDPYNGNAELSLDFLTPEYLYKNNLGSRITMLCRKK